MYVEIYICIHIYMGACLHRHAYKQTCICALHVYTHIPACMHTHMHTYTYIIYFTNIPTYI